MTASAKEAVYWAAHEIPEKCVEYLVDIWNADTEATTWPVTDDHCNTDSIERKIYSITLNKKKHFKLQLFINWIQVDV